MEILIPLKGLIDIQAECDRLSKEIAKFEKEVQRADAKLSNASFMERAPADVVAKERQALAENQAAIDKLTLQLKKMKS
jgi:valyl-tRNA synthetase